MAIVPVEEEGIVQKVLVVAKKCPEAVQIHCLMTCRLEAGHSVMYEKVCIEQAEPRSVVFGKVCIEKAEQVGKEVERWVYCLSQKR